MHIYLSELTISVIYNDTVHYGVELKFFTGTISLYVAMCKLYWQLLL